MPYQDPASKAPIVSPEFDPFARYQIATLNPEYTGTILGIRFSEGAAIVHGLAADADEEEQAKRVRDLLWFWNADGAWKLHTTDEGKVYKRTWEPVYTITLDESSLRVVPGAKNNGRQLAEQSA